MSKSKPGAVSFALQGVGVSGGIAIGRAHVVSDESVDVIQFALPKYLIAEEVNRFREAIATTRAELDHLRSGLSSSAPHELQAFLDLHLAILSDATLVEAPVEIIEKQRCNAEWALKIQMDALIAQFDAIEDEYLRERKADVVQVVDRILKALTGRPGHTPPPGDNVILVTHDLSPADMAAFRQSQFIAFLTDVGGATSHTAILARSLKIPAVLALYQARQLIAENDLLIADGSSGVVIVNPDTQVLEEYHQRKEQWELERQKLKSLRRAPSQTSDGVKVRLLANIELPDDLEQVLESGAEGVGLFRSEFLFLGRDDLPSEEEQFESYRTVASRMKDKPVIIRTLDLGADKQPRFATHLPTNPALGLRAVRLCLNEPQMFLAQIRAILRASHYGKLQLLVPMLTTLDELRQVLTLIDKAKENLRAEGIPFDENIPLGGMIEVPAAALMVSHFARKLDFLSIGTNDLIQYTLAIDRTDDTVAHLYDPLNPAVLRLLRDTIHTGTRMGKEVSVCGEVAGDPKLTRLLLGLGLRALSMHPVHLLSVKQEVIRSHAERAQAIAERMLRTVEADKLHALLNQLNT